MPNLSTTASELAVGFGLLGIVPFEATVDDAWKLFDGTLDANDFIGFLDEYRDKIEHYQSFFELGYDLRRSYPTFVSSRIRQVKWVGGTRQARSTSVANDLLVLNTPISVKDESDIINNSSPHKAFISVPSGELPPTRSPNWFNVIAPAEYQDLYALAVKEYCPDLPESVVEFERPRRGKHASKVDREAIGRVLQRKRGSPLPPEFLTQYIPFCHCISERSAQLFNDNYAKALREGRKVAIEESVFGFFFRIDSQTYIHCGIEKNGARFALEVPDKSTVKQRWKLRNLQAAPAYESEQPVVEITVTIEDKVSKQRYSLGFHAQVRWSHLKFAKNPEAKIYKGQDKSTWPWAGVPMFNVFISGRQSRPIRKSKIGEGGFGEVWKAKPWDSSTLVALKQLCSTDANEDERRRFRREVQLQMGLQHPNIAQILQHDLEADDPWFTTPLARHNLAHEIRSLSQDHVRCISVFKQILDGIQFAHENGVIHRDIRPENILVYERDSIRIADFGLGKRVNSTSTPLDFTRYGQGIGHRAYVAPEQDVNIAYADKRSDIFSLGKTLYAMLTGSEPFPAMKMTCLPLPFVPIIQKCTDGDPDKRFQSIDALRSEIEKISDAM